jgi:hypothetical protein
VSLCPYLAAMYDGVSLLALDCRNNEGHISRISSTKFAIDSDHELGVIVDSNPVLGIFDSTPVLQVVVDSSPH